MYIDKHTNYILSPQCQIGLLQQQMHILWTSFVPMVQIPATCSHRVALPALWLSCTFSWVHGTCWSTPDILILHYMKHSYYMVFLGFIFSLCHKHQSLMQVRTRLHNLYTLWQLNMAMANPALIDDFPSYLQTRIHTYYLIWKFP